MARMTLLSRCIHAARRVLPVFVGMVLAGGAQELRWRSDLSPIREERLLVDQAHSEWADELVISSYPLRIFYDRMRECIDLAANTPYCQKLDLNKDGLIDETDRALLLEQSRLHWSWWRDAILSKEDPVEAGKRLNHSLASVWSEP